MSEVCEDVFDNVSIKLVILWFVIGMIFLFISLYFLVELVVDIVKYFGFLDFVIGLIIIVIGISLFELVVCIVGVLKNEDDLVLGNIVGLNIFNLFVVLLLVGIINLLIIDLFVVNCDVFIMIVVILVLIVMLLNFKGVCCINRVEGGFLLVVFIVY